MSLRHGDEGSPSALGPCAGRGTLSRHVGGRRLAAAACLLVASLGALPAYALDVPIVYTRCARTTEPWDVTLDVTIGGVTTPQTREMRGVDVYDVLPDVVNFFGDFSAPCDLVLRAPDDSERILFDCSSLPEESSCAAMDPAVSFDGKTIAFTVFRGSIEPGSISVSPKVVNSNAENTTHRFLESPNRYLNTVEAQLHLVDVATGTLTPLPYVPGKIDSGPAFLPDGRLTFTSNREGSSVTIVYTTYMAGQGSRLYSMDLAGKNVDLVSHHALSMEQHPFVLRDGRVLVSSWQLFGGLPFRGTNGAPGGHTTIGNEFHLFTQHPDGAVQFAFFGQHSGLMSKTGENHKASHFITQASDGRVWFTDYYRGNNNGLGVIHGVMPEPPGQEGIGPEEARTSGDVYAPRDVMSLARWSTSADAFAQVMPAPSLLHPAYDDPLPFAGKVGHAAALPGNGLLVTWGKGPCGTVTIDDVFEALGRPTPPYTSGTGGGTSMNVVTSLEMDTPGCDAGLYELTRIPSTHPSDLRLIVDSREWHEFQARAVVPYAAIHGVAAPTVIPRADAAASHPDLVVGTPFGLLGAASITDRETHPRGGLHFAGEYQFNRQGTDTIAYDDEELCGVRILAVAPNRGRNPFNQINNIAGERVSILGEFSVRHRDERGAPRLDANGNVDTSFLVRMPANTPYLMQGIDCDGRTLNTDQTWQSLRPGEVKTCGGCHVHSRESLSKFEDTFAATPSYRIPTLGTGTVPLLTGRNAQGAVTTRTVAGYGMQVTFDRDIFPLLQTRCASCHGGATPAGHLALDRPGRATAASSPTAPSTWFCLLRDRNQECLPPEARFNTGAGSADFTFRRPQVTRYMRAFNSRGSLLYWKAAGARTDNIDDAQFDATSARADIDLDFGAAHPTDMTPEELGLLARFIDTGTGAGPEELRDTHRPTLHLSALIENGAVQTLRVGTVDVGAGIDTSSLLVCVLGAGDACTHLGGAAQPHGVVSIPLAQPLTDPTVEVLARVVDLAGNSTEVRRTVGYLLGAPSPPPERPEVETPDVETPEEETPGAETPEEETPGAEAPEAEAPGVETSGPSDAESETPEAFSTVVSGCGCGQSLPLGGGGIVGLLVALAWRAGSRSRRWRGASPS